MPRSFILLVLIFGFFFPLLDNAFAEESPYRFQLELEPLEPKRLDDDALIPQELAVEETDPDLPHFTLPNMNIPTDRSHSNRALTKTQKDAFDIFASTLTPEDSKALSISPSGAGSLVEDVDYFSTKSPKFDYSVFTNH